ncbi:hypothetical protein AL00_02610 [Sphingobium indicum F2]|uniref:Uncharacterized protein n=1 Tax=Sphingobium indicum F2 TaxID=1450518 RepID=A0A8E0WV54_9SPHN|nr:hypothetical protein AL00_02610 [Sphingobium indicum F2]
MAVRRPLHARRPVLGRQSLPLPLARLFGFLERRCRQAPCRGLCQSALRAALRQGCDHPVARPSAERECHPSPEQRLKATTAPSASDAVHALNASSGRAETALLQKS